MLAANTKYLEDAKKEKEESKAITEKIEATLAENKEFDIKYDKFKKDFDGVMKDMITKLVSCMQEPVQFKYDPVQTSAKDAAKHMVGKKRIVILTGAGISASSGIPTFRGQDGFWKQQTNYAGESDPKEILTYRFFKKHPEAVWQWHYDFYKLLKNKKTNQGH